MHYKISAITLDAGLWNLSRHNYLDCQQYDGPFYVNFDSVADIEVNFLYVISEHVVLHFSVMSDLCGRSQIFSFVLTVC